jgi:4-hydroxy-3-methylbut-2-enyl diphosphate reductase
MEKSSSKTGSERTIKKLSEFGEGFRHHHENYAVTDITHLRETGGIWRIGDLAFHFPEHFGFCYGVDKAIDMVFETCERFRDRRIFLTDQLIHNPYINGKLREKGVHYLKRDAAHLLVVDQLKPEDVVVVSAFGTDFRDILRLREKGVTVVDSTCGAIINVWKRVEGYARNGFITVIHGKRNHEETRATVSQAVKEGGDYLAIENKIEALELAEVIAGNRAPAAFVSQYPGCAPKPTFTFDPAAAKMGMANQTTMLKGESLEIQEILRRAFMARFGEAATRERFRSFDTICGATQDRQDAMRKLLAEPLDLILVVGGFNSSNTSHLAEMADGKIAFFHIEGEGDIVSRDQIRSRNPRTGEVELREKWLPAGTRKIGITSGASTPDVTLLEIIRKIVAWQP